MKAINAFIANICFLVLSGKKINPQLGLNVAMFDCLCRH